MEICLLQMDERLGQCQSPITLSSPSWDLHPQARMSTLTRADSPGLNDSKGLCVSSTSPGQTSWAHTVCVSSPVSDPISYCSQLDTVHPLTLSEATDPVLACSNLPCSDTAGPQPGGEGTALLGSPQLAPCSHYSLTQVFQP